MDKINKALKKIKDDEQNKLKQILEKIEKGDLKNLEIKKLKGKDNIFRARKGKFRVIYKKEGKEIYVLAVERKNDNTYNF